MVFHRKALLAGILTLACASDAQAQKQYGPGVTDTEIKIGNVAPYSGPGSAYSAIAKAEDAYFKMLNESGGVNGRKITFISYDDGFSPPRAIEQTKTLLEKDGVLLTISALGIPAFAVQKYMNTNETPQLFILSGASKASAPATFPWSTGFVPPYAVESAIYAKHILQTKPNGKIGVLFQNDDFGRDFFNGLKKALGDKASKMIVAEMPYLPTDPTVDSQVVGIQNAGADIFISLTTPRAAAQALRKVAELGWKPTYYQSSVSTSIGTVLKPVGLDKAVGMLSAGIYKDASDPAWKDDAGMKRYVAFMDKYLPGADKSDSSYAVGYASAATLEYVLRKSGDNLTRKNVLDIAVAMHGVTLDILLPGIAFEMTPTSYFPFRKMSMIRFNGASWDKLTAPIDGSEALD